MDFLNPAKPNDKEQTNWRVGLWPSSAGMEDRVRPADFSSERRQGTV
jgi:hypothetical protein